MEKRATIRVPVSSRVRYTEPGGDVRESLTAFLGSGGCFVLSNEPLSEGVVIPLDLTLGNNPESIKVVGKVVWKRIGSSGGFLAGFGVQFQNISSKDKKAIEEFIDSVVIRKAKSAGGIVPPRPKAGPAPA